MIYECLSIFNSSLKRIPRFRVFFVDTGIGIVFELIDKDRWIWKSKGQHFIAEEPIALFLPALWIENARLKNPIIYLSVRSRKLLWKITIKTCLLW